MKTIIAYTDGSAVVSGEYKGRGGFGVYFPDFYGKPKGIHKGYQHTKTGRSEQLALLHAIKSIPIGSQEEVILKVYSDSQYVVKSFTEKRLEKWKSNGWQNSSGNVKNKDLWGRILSEISKRPFLTLDMNWIKAHQLDKEKNPIELEKLRKDPHIVGNAMADKLADGWRETPFEDLKKDL